MRRLLVLLPLAGCLGADAQILESWEGIYKTQRMSLAESSCEEGPDVDSDPAFFEIDTSVGDGAHLVAIRRCSSATDCIGISWFESIVLEPTEKRLMGDVGDYTYSSFGHSCLVQWVRLKLTRNNADSAQLTVQIEVHNEDALDVEDEQDCLAILSNAPLDDDCDAFYVLDGKRTP